MMAQFQNKKQYLWLEENLAKSWNRLQWGIFFVARIETTRVVVAIAKSRFWSLYHLDIKSAFLNDPLEEIFYVTQIPYFVIKGKE